MLSVYQKANDKKNIIDVMNDIVENYNESVHKTIWQ